jgi:spore coat protein CotH
MGYDTPLQYRTEKKFPKDNDFTSLNTFVYNAKSMDDTAWSEWVDRYIDKEEVIRYLVIQNFLKVRDTARFNFYIYNYGKMLFLPWDNEMCMDLSTYHPMDGYSLITTRLLEEPSIRAGYNETMRRLFLTGEEDIQPFLDQNNPGNTENIIDDLLYEVNTITSEIDRAIYYESGSYFTYQDYIDEVNRVITFLNTRSGQISDPVLP